MKLGRKGVKEQAMSDKMMPLAIDRLFTLIFAELRQQNSVFGIPRASFFDAGKFPTLVCQRYGQLLETPWGVAAGPHTQLSQNLITAWLCGARYLELKTVQTLDEIEVSKPCIDMEDEGYNCEWSQELKLDQSYREYLNAWILIHILQRELGFGRKDGALGCIFNMSAGYDMEGLLKPNTQRFLQAMLGSAEAETEYRRALALIEPLYPRIDELDIPVAITNNITLSTMHGCPPDEIERIASYLIETLRLHTTVKLNPTLNGPASVRDILNRRLGFAAIDVPDEAFGHDLKWPEAVRLIRSLQRKAAAAHVTFNLKLTNTLEARNHKDVFAKSNAMMYMSGRPLHALALNVAKLLQTEFGGELDLSFSAGADAFNSTDVLACGIKPVTVCSDLLKPGGYARLLQYSERAASVMAQHQISSLDELPLAIAREKNRSKAVQKNIAATLERVLEHPGYKKESFPWTPIKGERPLGLFDCIAAPCTETCPTGQDVPSYIWLAAQGRHAEALAVIRESNPFPNTTGMACDHLCEDRCTRINYDAPVRIRDLKRAIAMQESREVALRNVRASQRLRPDKSVAIIGGGPAGLSAAWFLAHEGLTVEVFEAKSAAGGMVAHALPDFRAVKERVDLDIDRIKAAGVVLHESHPIHTRAEFDTILAGHDYVYVAVGAAVSKPMGVPGEDCEGVLGFLEFLERVKHGAITSLPKRVAVVGGGNSAIDAVRSAKRLLPKDGELMLLYRRTIKEMPASREELQELLAEKIELVELTAPVRVVAENGKLTGLECQRMELLPSPKGGRPSPRTIPGSEHVIALDLVIPAIGQDTALGFLRDVVGLARNGLVQTTGESQANGRGTAHRTTQAKVFAGGDVVRGPSSIIKGIADGKAFAHAVLADLGLAIPASLNPVAAGKPSGGKLPDARALTALRQKRARRDFGRPSPKCSDQAREGFSLVTLTFNEEDTRAEAARCLLCDEICEVCVSVCPNRANVSYKLEPRQYLVRDLTLSPSGASPTGSAYEVVFAQTHQTLNIGDLCNECGNCRTFCPTAGAPYVDKPKIYLSRATFDAEKNNCWYLDRATATLFTRFDGVEWSLLRQGHALCLQTPIAEMSFDLDTLAPCGEARAHATTTISMQRVAAMAVLLEVLLESVLFAGPTVVP